MIRGLHRKVSDFWWDCAVTWRALRGREARIFHGVPLEVVGRWARKERGGLDGHPEIQDAIGFALGELHARCGTGALPGPCRVAGARPATPPARAWRRGVAR